LKTVEIKLIIKQMRPQYSGPIIVLLFTLALCACAARTNSGPSIEITQIPPEDQGGVLKIDRIAGRVKGARSDQKVVLYARSGAWYVQPWADQPFTKIDNDSTGPTKLTLALNTPRSSSIAITHPFP